MKSALFHARSILALSGGAALVLFAAAVRQDLWWLFGAGAILLAAAVAAGWRGASSPPGIALQAVEDLCSGGTPDWQALEQHGPIGRMVHKLGRAVHRAQQELAVQRKGTLNLALPLIFCDIQGRVVLVNKQMCAALGRQEGAILGRHVAEVFFGQPGDSPLEKALAGGGPLDQECALRLWDGRDWHVRCVLSSARDDSGESGGFFLLCVDLQGLKEQQARLEEENRKRLLLGEEFNELSQRVASAAEELSASADEQARGAKLQKEQTDSVAEAMEQMAATVLEVARNSSRASSAAHEARDSAREGAGMVEAAMVGITGVADSARQLADVLSQLNVQAASIGKIINVINEIADQTNLLALNAAIEAARAGDAGRGFAVVADEVRKLAEKTMAATMEVESAIKTIQGRSGEAVASMEQTERLVRESTEHSNRAGNALTLITNRIEESVAQVTQIAAAAEEQSAAAEQINRSVEGISAVAAEADEGAGQAASATRDLAVLAQELLSVAQNFSGAVSDSGRLHASEGQMKGVLPKLMLDYIRDAFGERVFRRVQEQMGNPVFLPTASYPDRVLHQMAEIASSLTSKSSRDIFLGLGLFTVPRFHAMYRRYFNAKNLKDFYLKMNEIHARLTRDHPGVNPPSFTYEDKGDVLFMNYRSRRGLFDYFEGILKSAAQFMNEKADIVVKPLDEHTARAEVRFLGPAK